jgi:hypothetical protein
MGARTLAAISVALFAVPVLAQAPAISVEKAECFPTEKNGIVHATVKPEVGGASTRLYFRWDEHGDFYWVDMVAAGGGAYWGIPAKPERRNESVEYQVRVVDPAGQVLARSDSLISPVKKDCQVDLSDKEYGVSENLVIGETVPAQEGKRVLGFMCDGVVSRVNAAGILRADEVCRACVIAWWEKKDFLVPAVVAGGAVTGILIEQPEPSPSRP